MKRAYYQDNISNFLKENPRTILGELTPYQSVEQTQSDAWRIQISNLQEQLKDSIFGEIFFEFSIPRMGKRADVILLIQNIVFVLEYKVGATTHERYAADQVLDYALDLKNFHAGSHNKLIVPIVISTRAEKTPPKGFRYADNLFATFFSNGSDLGDIIRKVLSTMIYARVENNTHSYGFNEPPQEPLNLEDWSESGYKPTPTIIEAAQALYRKHSVEEISRSDAGIQNLTVTTKCINEIIAKSKRDGRKSICFVTGVPGAGKTLAGLNISNQKDESSDEHAVFLSGNGPLVAVLREALARDEVARTKEEENPVSKKDALRKINKFIQNVHNFRDEGIRDSRAPNEHVVVFDEAQRAWNQAQAEKFMTQKKKLPSFDMSEPEFLISVMDRRQDWCTIVCLIGGGQEINTGEAGLIEWFNALQKRFRHWDVYHSGQLSNKNYNLGEDLAGKLESLNCIQEDGLHLNVSIRSYRAEKLSEFVGAVVEGNAELAKNCFSFLQKYPLVITRNINEARYWLRRHARGTERLGLIASSGAIRLKPEGITVKAKIDPVTWFLNGKEDIRSSYYLEDVATEFDVQGLELDWTGVCWDADLRFENSKWGLYDFKGTKWQSVKDELRQVYLVNAYRVLLTRARQGMVIFVPHGDTNDPTRPPKFYDATFNFLKRCGIPELNAAE